MTFFILQTDLAIFKISYYLPVCTGYFALYTVHRPSIFFVRGFLLDTVPI